MSARGEFLTRFVVRVGLVCLVLLAVDLNGRLPTVEARRFSSCSQLRAAFPYGVAKASRFVGSSKARVDRRVYAQNHRFDSDNDGVACEFEYLQTGATRSSPLITASTLPTSPTGSWLLRNFYASSVLSVGSSYQIFTCASGAGNTAFEVLIGAEWVRKSPSYVSPSSSSCVDPSFPYMHSYYWTVDVAVSGGSGFYDVRLVGFSSTSSAKWAIAAPGAAGTVSSCPTGVVRIVPEKLHDGYRFFFNVFNETSASVRRDYIRVKFFGSSSGESITESFWSQGSIYELRPGWKDYRSAMSNVFFSPTANLLDASYSWYSMQFDRYQGNKTCPPPVVQVDQSVLASTK